ncbi:MAG: arylsulfatase [Opitutales bacterium]
MIKQKVRTIPARLFPALYLSLAAFLPTLAAKAETAPRPNVVIIMTDDQGYGEVAAHGNPIIKTPHLDKLHGESVRFTDFHVDPTCSPTRAAALTGRYSTRTGVWHTINGRSMMRTEELTLAEVFKANGYDTSLFGKWHIGDNYPCRPDDQGYDHVVWHHGGALKNGPDYWGNDYYDDTFKVNGEWQQFEGYCTDVWFDEAIRYIEEPRKKPFFMSIHTNAPHSPYIVPESYSKPYLEAGMSETMAIFYGMITSIDENIGRFRDRLQELGLAENTLLVFMTDNGTTAGWITLGSGEYYYNAGMRGWKSSVYEGGHRVPIFWHWPAGNLTEGRDVPDLTAHIDLLPTFVDLLQLKKPAGPPLDGISLASLLKDKEASIPERTLFVHEQRQYLPPKWVDSVAMTTRWRLVHGLELYDIKADPGQEHDIAAQHPEVVAELRAEYEAWWQSLEKDMEQTVRYTIGGGENPMTLSSHDWLMEPGERDAVWHQSHIARGDIGNAPWAIHVERAGTYEITLQRWAPYLNKPMGMVEGRLRIGDAVYTQELSEEATGATFRVNLEPGPTMLKTWLKRPGRDRVEHGAYYLRVELLDKHSDAAHRR